MQFRCFLQVHRLNINETAIFPQTFSYLILYINHKKITFSNYTGFVVNYDEDQYIPNF